MKLKKLLPIAAVASTAAVVAPLVTSCGIASIKWSTDIVDGEIKNPYKSQVTPHATTTEQISTEVGEQQYFDDVAKNPKIFADDWMQTLFYEITDIPSSNPSSYNGKGSINLSLSKIQDKQISGKINMKLEADQPLTLNEESEGGSTKMNLNVSFKNVPVKLDYIEVTPQIGYKWCIMADNSKIEDGDWQVKMSMLFEFTEITEKGTMTEIMKGDETFDKDNIGSAWQNYVRFASFYFDKVAHE